MTQEESRPAVTGALPSEGASQETGSGLNQCGICEGSGRLVRTLERGEVSSDCGNCGGAGVLPARPAVEEGPREDIDSLRIEEQITVERYIGALLADDVLSVLVATEEGNVEIIFPADALAHRVYSVLVDERAARPLVQEDDPRRVVDTWETRCSNCNRELGDFTIYVEDRDGRAFDGRASVAASFVYCGPKCLASHAESYGEA